MKHEPPPRPLRDFAEAAMRVMDAGGRFLLWLGGGLVVIAPIVWLLNRDRGDLIVSNLGLSFLAWAAILVGWHLVLTFLRWWIWWHEDESR